MFEWIIKSIQITFFDYLAFAKAFSKMLDSTICLRHILLDSETRLFSSMRFLMNYAALKG